MKKLSKSVNICESCCKKFTATFFMPHSVYCHAVVCRAGKWILRQWQKWQNSKSSPLQDW